MPSPFPAFRVFSTGGRAHGEIVQATLDELSPGEVIIDAAYSSVNYKDALGATGAGKILTRFPLIGGIDVAGTVVEDASGRFAPGAQVLVTGYELGVSHDGGYAAQARVPADWVVPLPDGLTLFEAMALGTAGFTAGLALVRMEQNGLRPDQGPVVVTGATGGVGSLAVVMLARSGYEVTAITGKDDAHGFLGELGAATVLSRQTLQMDTRPLAKATWAGAVDTVGGDTLAWLTRTTRPWGSIASIGLTGGTDLHTTVMPFILRGVNLLGINSSGCPMPLRREVWRRLSTDLKPPVLQSMAQVIPLEGLPDAFATLLRGAARGRIVVRI
jgi:acrylyl-CoA reductase (NADPH)